MAKARYTKDDYAGDQLERPVRLNGIYCHVIDYDGEPGPGGQVTVQAWQAPYRYGLAGRFVGEPVTVPLTDCIPLCAHCGEELEESEDFGPGECHQPECFLRVI